MFVSCSMCAVFLCVLKVVDVKKNNFLYVLNAAAGEAQDHGQNGGVIGAIWGRRPGLRRSAGGLHTAVPVSSAALQRHEGTSHATQAADQGNNFPLFGIREAFLIFRGNLFGLRFGSKSFSDPVILQDLLAFYPALSVNPWQVAYIVCMQTNILHTGGKRTLVTYNQEEIKIKWDTNCCCRSWELRGFFCPLL